MNSVSTITDKILADAQAYADEQLSQAESEAQSVRAQYNEQAAKEVERILSQAQARAQAADERAKSQADMDRRKRLLAARQESVSKAFDRALQVLCALPDEDKALLMVRLAVKYQTADAEYIFNAADQELIGPLVVKTVDAIHTKQQLKDTFSGSFMEQVKKLVSGGAGKYKTTMSPQVGRFAGGFILKQGEVEQNCTFEVLIGGVRDEMEADVCALLFG